MKGNLVHAATFVALLLGSAWSAQATLIEIKFSTSPVSLVTGGTADEQASQTAFLAALTKNSLNPANFGGVSGVFFYDSTTAGDSSNPQNFNGAVDSLSFSVANWFSQSLTNVGVNGDITVGNNLNNSSGQAIVDRIQVVVMCAPPVNNTAQPTCTAQPYNFTYAITDADTGVTWTLDQFILLLTENSSNEPLSSTNLPTRAEWESTQWQTRRVDLRFNPSCAPEADTAACANVLERATISFLAVPEPATLALMGLGLAGLGFSRRRAH